MLFTLQMLPAGACARVREWRTKHPKYWQHRPLALQDLYLAQQSLVVGLVALLTDTLQEVMAPVLAQFSFQWHAWENCARR